MDTTGYRFRIPLMGSALVILAAATWAGLIRLGWRLPAFQPELPISHGPLMVAGFFGTLISLERAVAMRKAWTYAGPILSGVGGLLSVVGLFGQVGPVLMTLGSLMLVVLFGVVLRKHLAGYMVVMALGALALLLGNILWLSGWPVYKFVFLWAGFLVLTIAGERLELGRMVQRSKFNRVAFTAVIGIYLVGLGLMLLSWDLGVRIGGVGMIGLGLWLLRYDIARRTVKRDGLTRFIAVCLLSGYLWLLVSGGMSMVYGGIPAGPIYDTMLHAITLGFVFVMIFGHAPIIFPAVLGLEIEYKPTFYLPLVALHLSLILRTGGELMGSSGARLWGGLFNVIAVLVYLVMISPLPALIKGKGGKDKG